jgi:hypothetical protein
MLTSSCSSSSLASSSAALNSESRPAVKWESTTQCTSSSVWCTHCRLNHCLLSCLNHHVLENPCQVQCSTSKARGLTRGYLESWRVFAIGRTFPRLAGLGDRIQSPLLGGHMGLAWSTNRMVAQILQKKRQCNLKR